MRKPVFPVCLSTPRPNTPTSTLIRKLHIASVRGVITLSACWMLAGCSHETLFQSDFAKYALHSPPIGAQKVGTTEVDPVSDQYVWATGAGGTVWITRADHVDPVPRAALLCKFAQFKGDVRMSSPPFCTCATARVRQPFSSSPSINRSDAMETDSYTLISCRITPCESMITMPSNSGHSLGIRSSLCK